jgi:hypothetical protein
MRWSRNRFCVEKATLQFEVENLRAIWQPCARSGCVAAGVGDGEGELGAEEELFAAA